MRSSATHERQAQHRHTVLKALYTTPPATTTRPAVQLRSRQYDRHQNTASGEALFSNTTGSYNTANGYDALYSNTTGGFNAANGVLALYNNTTGNFNTATGPGALFSNTTGSNNVA